MARKLSRKRLLEKWRAPIDDLNRRLFPFQESEFEQESFTDVGRLRVAQWLEDNFGGRVTYSAHE